MIFIATTRIVVGRFRLRRVTRLSNQHLAQPAVVRGGHIIEVMILQVSDGSVGIKLGTVALAASISVNFTDISFVVLHPDRGDDIVPLVGEPVARFEVSGPPAAVAFVVSVVAGT